MDGAVVACVECGGRLVDDLSMDLLFVAVYVAYLGGCLCIDE